MRILGARRRERERLARAAVVALLAEYDWTYVVTMQRQLRIGFGRLYIALAQLEAAGTVEARWERPEEFHQNPRRRMYRLSKEAWIQR